MEWYGNKYKEKKRMREYNIKQKNWKIRICILDEMDSFYEYCIMVMNFLIFTLNIIIIIIMPLLDFVIVVF